MHPSCSWEKAARTGAVCWADSATAAAVHPVVLSLTHELVFVCMEPLKHVLVRGVARPEQATTRRTSSGMAAPHNGSVNLFLPLQECE